MALFRIASAPYTLVVKLQVGHEPLIENRSCKEIASITLFHKTFEKCQFGQHLALRLSHSESGEVLNTVHHLIERIDVISVSCLKFLVEYHSQFYTQVDSENTSTVQDKTQMNSC